MICTYLIYVTEFVKRDFHAHPIYQLWRFVTSDIDLKFGQQEAPTLVKSWRNFQLHMYSDNKVMVLQVHEIGCVWKTPFCISGHTYIWHPWAYMGENICYICNKNWWFLHRLNSQRRLFAIIDMTNLLLKERPSIQYQVSAVAIHTKLPYWKWSYKWAQKP